MTNQKIMLVHVSEVEVAENGNPFYLARFKQGHLGKAVVRTFWGKHNEGDDLVWDRISPEELSQLKGRNLSGEITIEAVDIEPQEFIVPETGEVRMFSSRAIVRFADETVEQAVRRYGSVLRNTESHRQTEPMQLLSQNGLVPGLAG